MKNSINSSSNLLYTAIFKSGPQEFDYAQFGGIPHILATLWERRQNVSAVCTEPEELSGRNLKCEITEPFQQNISNIARARLFQYGFLKDHSGLKNQFIKKLKTLYYHKITQRIHFCKNPEKYIVRIFPGIRIFPDFFCTMLPGVI